ncbi:facilitated trehalose transporter Tret1-2 homolog [Bradysia coprophila]|uniref:facilitated trehalose transporter Tret1-2 homolog n=1 Tax=Bradysia coprophila TaxID=38358 RepID=UPI00187D89A3|nr:facilitated trehalose transporter Tret1-2 homolog [Bradysia coprophila]
MSSDVSLVKQSELTSENVKYQFLASVCVNVIVLAQGCSAGWMSPSLPVLLSEDSPLASGKLTLEAASWIGSLFALGAAVGVIIFGTLSLFIGNKRSLLLCAFPITIFWFTVIYAQNPWHLSFGRFTTGLTGGAFICIQLFVAEIADHRIRGALASLLTLNFNIGIVFGYITGAYLQWFSRCVVLMVFPFIFFVLFSFIPESPQYFLKIGQTENAERSLRFYRNCKVGSDNEMELQKELAKLIEIAERNKCEEKVKLKDFLNPVSMRAMLIGPILMAVSQFSGTFTLVSYGATIFEESGSTMNPNLSTIILGCLQIAGTISTYFLIDRIGRKLLLTISCSGAAIGLSVMGIYCYLNKHQSNIDLSQYNWIPVVTLSFVIYISSIGIIPVPYIIISEVLPQKIKRIGGPICMSSVSVFAFIMLKVFPSLMLGLDLYGCMFLFSAVNVLGIIFTKVVVPETKGRNLDVLDSPADQKERSECDLYITRL